MVAKKKLRFVAAINTKMVDKIFERLYINILLHFIPYYKFIMLKKVVK